MSVLQIYKKLQLFIVLVIGMTGTAISQESTSPNPQLDRQITSLRSELASNSDLSDEQREQFVKQLGAIEIVDQQASAQREKVEAALEVARRADEIIGTTEAERDRLEIEYQIDISELSPNALQARLTELETDRQTNSLQLSDLRKQAAALVGRADFITRELVAAQKAVEKTDTDKLEETSGSISIADRISSLNRFVRVSALKGRIEYLQKEISTISSREQVRKAQIDLGEARSSYIAEAIAQTQSALRKTQSAVAADLKAKAQNFRMTLSSSNRESIEIADQNVALAERLIKLNANSEKYDGRLKLARSQSEQLSRSKESVDRILNAGILNDELVKALRRVRQNLPQVSILEDQVDENQSEIARLETSLILLQEEEQMHGESASSPEVGLEQEAKTNRMEINAVLLVATQKQLNRIADYNIALQEVIRLASNLDTQLDKSLLWSRTHQTFSKTWLVTVRSGIVWMIGTKNWGDMWATLVSVIWANIALILLVILVSLSILVARKRFSKWSDDLNKRVGKLGRDTFWVTPAAICLSIFAALPMSLLPGVIGYLLLNPSDPFVNAIGVGLIASSSVLFILLSFQNIARSNAVLDAHFGWPSSAYQKLHFHLGRLLLVQAITVFFLSMAIASKVPDVRYGIGLIAFLVGSVSLSIFAYYFFKPRGGIAADIIQKAPYLSVLRFLFPIMVLVPLIIGVLPVFGFVDTAFELQGRVFQSFIIMLAVAIVHGLFIRFFMVGHRRMTLWIRKQQRAEHAKQAEDVAVTKILGEVAPDTNKFISVTPEQLERQIRRLLMGLTVLLLAFGLSYCWRDILPAFGILNDIALWQRAGDADGLAMVTLSDLLLSIAIVVGVFWFVPNLWGLLDVTPLGRIEVEPGTRYATVTIINYVIIGIGVTISLSVLGLDWSKLQWIVAALGVGLGFGLQEIVANFVSGLIILFERPIRVGDMVTIGDLSGTVKHVKIRATTVTDFDNHDVLLPNKTIISENVINWTLSDKVTRVIVPIGVAYGSDIELVKGLLLKIGHDHPDTLEEPPPMVLFVGHGDSSLDFELRTFIPDPRLRLTVPNDLNTSINKALNENNIQIPFPQRDLHIKNGAAENAAQEPTL